MKAFIITLTIAMFAAIGLNAHTGDTEVLTDDIFNAIRNIDYTSINVLLSDGTDVDTADHEGNSPLMVATQIGNPRIVNIILSHKPEINAQNKKGTTALMIAAQTGQFHIMKELLARGADAYLYDSEGNTALTLASKYGHNQIVTLLQNKRIPQSYTK